MGSAANLQLEIDKGELNIFVLCGNALDVEADRAESRREDGNHPATIFDLHPEPHRVAALNHFIPVQLDEPVRLLTHFQKVAAVVTMHH